MVFVLLVHVDVVNDFTMLDSVDVVSRYHNVVDPVQSAVAFVGVGRPFRFAYRVDCSEIVVL